MLTVRYHVSRGMTMLRPCQAIFPYSVKIVMYHALVHFLGCVITVEAYEKYRYYQFYSIY